MEVVQRTAALRSGVRLEVVTVVWMALEAVLAIGAGIAARSVLLTAFGLDSVIELLSGVTLLWRPSTIANRAASPNETSDASRPRVRRSPRASRHRLP